MLGGYFEKPNEQVVIVNFDFGFYFWSFHHLEKLILRRKENTQEYFYLSNCQLLTVKLAYVDIIFIVNKLSVHQNNP